MHTRMPENVTWLSDPVLTQHVFEPVGPVHGPRTTMSTKSALVEKGELFTPE
jgi:hypothetical protein